MPIEAPATVQQVAICSINVGRPNAITVGERVIETGFYKEPVKGAIEVGFTGIAGDHIADPSRHGGEDQAVYLFSEEDCRWWSSELGRVIGPGFFGENITIDRWWSQPRVGDRIRFKSLTLEVSFPRIPCSTLAARVGDPRFLKTFARASRPGLYARVLSPGPIVAEEVGEVLAGPASHPTAEELFAAWHEAPRRSPGLLLSALAAPIASRARPILDAWLAQSTQSR